MLYAHDVRMWKKKQQTEHQPPQRRGFRPKEEIKAGTIREDPKFSHYCKTKGICEIWVQNLVYIA